MIIKNGVVVIFYQRRLLFAFMCLVLTTSSVNAEDYFAINIGSSLQQPNAVAIKEPILAQKYIVYSVRTDVDGINRYRQRIGFFTSRDEARNVQEKINKQFPNTWIDKISPDETGLLNNWLSTATPAIVTPQAALTLPIPVPSAPEIPAAKIIDPVPTVTNNTEPVNDNEQLLAKLMDDAKKALVEKNNALAIQIYNRVIHEGESLYQQEAQEFLGVARERNGQLAHATAEYKTYLKLYPTGENADRVRQRLNGLLTATDKPQSTSNIVKKEEQSAYWDFFGTAYQYYDRDTIKPSTGDSIVANSLLTSGVNYSGRLMNGNYKMRTNISALHIYDFVDGETDQTRVNDMYFDMISPEQVIDTRIGRQKGRSSGVIGRFDGVDLGYRFNPSHQIKLISGYPVDFSGSTVAHTTDKYFISLGYSWSGFLPNWEANIFTLQQVADGITDRQEVGGEVRYRTPEESFFSTLDYSTAFGEINYLMMVYNRRLADQTSIDVIADYRKSPFLTTSSSLQGQTGVSTLGDLVITLSESELEQLAMDRTGVYKSITTLYTRSLRENLDFNADFSISNLSGTDATTAAGVITQVDAQAGTGNELSYGAGLVRSNLLTTNDINILNMRFSQLFNSNALSITGSAKYRVHTDWRLGPKLFWGKREYDDGRSTDKLAPSFRLEYRQNKNWQFESEITFENETTTSTTGTDKESNYFIHLGYYYIF